MICGDKIDIFWTLSVFCAREVVSDFEAVFVFVYTQPVLVYVETVECEECGHCDTCHCCLKTRTALQLRSSHK